MLVLLAAVAMEALARAAPARRQNIAPEGDASEGAAPARDDASGGIQAVTLDGALAEALGGAENIAGSGLAAGRLRVTVRDGGAVDEVALSRAASRGWVRLEGGVLHILR